jgi:CheY-like chemotaxis protein
MGGEPVFLYVEDDAMSREVMEMLMVYRLNYSKITIFEDTSDFLNKLERMSEKPTIFLLDIHVKPYSGFEILQVLRTHEQFSKTKIVAVTASVMNEEVEALQSSGFDGVISKPIDPDTFGEVVQAILNGHKVWQLSS